MDSQTPSPRPADTILRIVCSALALAVCLLPIRAVVIGYGWYSFGRAFEEIPGAIIGGCYDVCYVIVTAIPFLLAALILRNRTWPRRIVSAAYAVFALVSLLAALANVEVVRMLGRPFNYQWLYYADFLRSPDAINGMRATVSNQLILWTIWLIGSMWTIALALRWTIGVARRRGLATSTLVCVAAPVICFYLFFAHWYLVTQQWPHAKIANPIAEFAHSLWRTTQAPALFTMPTRAGDDDEFRIAAQRGASTPAPRNPQVRNVILFVLESVPAEYIEVYGGKYPVTPNLSRYRDRAAVFHNVYAHAPATNKSLSTLLCSTYPWISYRTLSQEHPDVALGSLSGTLHELGYRTGFFASGDLVYQGAGNFLQHRGFDRVEDYRTRTTAAGSTIVNKQYDYLNGTDDIATVDSMIRWLAAQRSADANRPTFAMLWTLTTHHPYFVAGKERDFGVSEPNFNRYLNALHHGDEAFGRLMRWLEENGMLDSTLVVVVGDHGEAFGRHGQWGHGAKIYEENLRVPMLLINPRLFKGEDHGWVGGLVDVAPTIMDVLGQRRAPTWQGTSLFDTNRTNRTYFFAPWSDFLFGMRDGDRKVIFDATNATFELYDLKRDPNEQRNLAAESPPFVRACEQRLAAWVQYQAKFYDDAFAGRLAAPAATARLGREAKRAGAE